MSAIETALTELSANLRRMEQRHQATGYKFDRLYGLIDAAREELATLTRLAETPAIGPAGLDWLISDIRKLPTIRASEIDGEESDGTPRHWRNRPFVSLTQLERLLREFLTQPPSEAT